MQNGTYDFSGAQKKKKQVLKLWSIGCFKMDSYNFKGLKSEFLLLSIVGP